jgi:hypothetical protein
LLPEVQKFFKLKHDCVIVDITLKRVEFVECAAGLLSEFVYFFLWHSGPVCNVLILYERHEGRLKHVSYSELPYDLLLRVLEEMHGPLACYYYRFWRHEVLLGTHHAVALRQKIGYWIDKVPVPVLIVESKERFYSFCVSLPFVHELSVLFFERERRCQYRLQVLCLLPCRARRRLKLDKVGVVISLVKTSVHGRMFNVWKLCERAELEKLFCDKLL